MTYREVKKELMKFVRQEVKEKGADWAELRRIKRHVVIKKGLPSVPNLVIKTDAGLSYMAIIHSRKEIRLYLFASEGQMLHGQSYFSSFEEIAKDLHSKSKKIARFPPLEKKLTRAQQNHQLDRQFKQIWDRLAKSLGISKPQRRQRPLIKGISKEADGIFGTILSKNFIQIPYQSSNLGVIFHYYALYFFLPLTIRQNEVLAEAIAMKLLSSLKKIEVKKALESRDSQEIIREFKVWDSIEPKDIYNLLKKVDLYYDFPWETKDFITLIQLPLNLLKAPSRQNLHNLFHQLFSNSQNEDFLILACFLGIPFNFDCQISSEKLKNSTILIYNLLKTWRISQVLPLIEKQEARFSAGLMKAIKEALHFQYTKILEINFELVGTFKIRNKSDSPIFLTSATQILPNGTETEVTFELVTLPANATFLLDFNSINISGQSPLRIQYSVAKSLEDSSNPIFVGTLVI